MLQTAIDLLHKEDLTCVILGREETLRFRLRGIRPMTDTLRDHPEVLKGAYIADRIIGKAAAMLAVAGGANAVYGEVMSEAGLEMLRKHGIEAQYGTLTTAIRNRENTGLCPMEQTVQNLNDPQDALPALLATLTRLSSKPLSVSSDLWAASS